MHDEKKRLFLGMKISTTLQRDLDKCPGGAELYFEKDKPESLRIVSFGEDKIIGRFLRDGFPVTDIENVSRALRSMLILITSGHRIEEDSIRIYVDSSIPVSPMPISPQLAS